MVRVYFSISPSLTGSFSRLNASSPSLGDVAMNVNRRFWRPCTNLGLNWVINGGFYLPSLHWPLYRIPT